MVYVADLAPVLAEAARVLAPGGLLAFTTETHDGEGVVIGEGLRYAHAAAYVRAAVECRRPQIVPAGRSLRPQRGQRAGARAWSPSPRKLESRRYAAREWRHCVRHVSYCH